MSKTIRIWSETLAQVKVPLPFPLRWVNSYVIRSRSGWTVIDPGLHTPEAKEIWQQAMQELNLQMDALNAIVLTHHHPDHYGLSGWFQQQSGGAPVYLSQTGKEQAEALWGAGMPMTDTLLALFRVHGLDESTLEQMKAHMDGFLPQLSPQPDIRVIDMERPFPLGDRMYRPIVTPGHAAGHVCFLDEERRELFCGDHVLPQITPNVSYIPGFDENPLQSYLHSLGSVGRLTVERAYPGHRDPFETFSERAADIVRHHEERLKAMEERLDEGSTSYAVCRAFFGERLSIHQLRFALSETIAHLLYLRDAGRITESERDGVVWYAR